MGRTRGISYTLKEMQSGSLDQRAEDRPREGATPEPLIAPRAEYFINRELSWLEFNQRVLDEARDPRVPLLERLKFLAIVRTNLDEFFMVRVAGLVEQREEHVRELPPDGMTPAEQLDAIAARTARMLEDLSAVVTQEFLPALREAGVALVHPSTLARAERARLSTYFFEQVYPILTPLAIDPGHPFPHVPNKSLNLIVMLAARRGESFAFAVLQVPSVLSRLVPVSGPGEVATFVLLEDIIAEHAGKLFSGFDCLGAWPFRVIRNFDLSIDEEEAEDLLETIKEEVRRRDRGRVVAMTVDALCPRDAIAMLERATGVDPKFVGKMAGPQAIHQLVGLSKPLAQRPELVDPPFQPVSSPVFSREGTMFETIARGDVLLHHPYESFDPVVAFIEQAVTDPDVLAIKQTLYRTSADSPIVKALIRAADQGKQVAALVEIKARFDEENNIHWARKLEEAGVHVVYGLVGLKTHCKVTLIVRREGKSLVRYVHFGTGNYNPNTARLYTDLSLFTARPEFGEDATALLNLLTSCTAPRSWRKLVVAPLGFQESILGYLEREAENARRGRPARIIAKMNALVDQDVIMALYRASQAGVEIDLIIRGICCLRPGVPGLSERIRVRSVVDRFLEHSRIYYFASDGEDRLYISSADWMPRNFHRRIEVMVPIDDPAAKARIRDEVLGLALRDNQKARRMTPEGHFELVSANEGEEPIRSQVRSYELAKELRQQRQEELRSERPYLVRPIRIRPSAEAEVGATVAPPSKADEEGRDEGGA
jgi:polyphosphate kinase